MALEPINVVTHSREIEQEYLKVIRGNDPDTTWLIISPDEKKEYAPQYVGSGFSEFLNSFEDVKVQYGLARVPPPGSDVEKLVLVGWCPDSAPMKARASFASNFGTVANQVLKSYHIQVTARDQDDLDENQLLERVSNAAGARYSIQSAGTGVSASAPKTAGSSRLATPSPAPAAGAGAGVGPPPAAPSKPASEPTPAAKQLSGDEDDDWGEPEVKERDLETEPVKTNQSSYKPVGKVDLQRIIAEENSREDPRLVSNVSVEGKKAPDAGVISSANTGSNVSRPETKAKDTGSTAGGSVLGTKPPINFGASRGKDDDKVIKGFKNEKSPAQIWAEKKAAQNGGNQPSAGPSPGPTSTMGPSAPESTNAEDDKEPEVKDLKSKFEQLSTSNEPPIIQPKASTDSNPSDKAVTEAAPPVPSNDKKHFGTPLPGMHNEEDNLDKNEDEGGDDDEWDDNEQPSSSAPNFPSRNTAPPPPSFTSNTPAPPTQPSDAQPQLASESLKEKEADEQGTSAPAPPLPSRTYEQEPPAPPLPSRSGDHHQSQEEEQPPALPSRNADPQQKEQEEQAPPLPARQVENDNAGSGSNTTAVAEFDYEAAEDNELTFKEHDRIVNIELVDEDWWLGELEGTGEKGLFPSNYVFLQR